MKKKFLFFGLRCRFGFQEMMEDKPPTPYQSARVQREPPPVLRGKGEEPALKVKPAASLWVSLPNPSMFGNPPNTPAAWSGHTNWLARRFHFSCDGEWKNGPTNFGPIKMVNDCVMMPQRKIEKQESDLELLTFVYQGRLVGIDSFRIRHTSCGFGTKVSSCSLDEVTHFLQIGLAPKKFGGVVKESIVETGEPGKLAHVMSVEVCEVLVGRDLEGNHSFVVAPDKRCYLVVLAGGAKVGSQRLSVGDGATIVGPFSLDIEVQEKCLLVLLVVPQQKS